MLRGRGWSILSKSMHASPRGWTSEAAVFFLAYHTVHYIWTLHLSLPSFLPPGESPRADPGQGPPIRALGSLSIFLSFCRARAPREPVPRRPLPPFSVEGALGPQRNGLFHPLSISLSLRLSFFFLLCLGVTVSQTLSLSLSDSLSLGPPAIAFAGAGLRREASGGETCGEVPQRRKARVPEYFCCFGPVETAGTSMAEMTP